MAHEGKDNFDYKMMVIKMKARINLVIFVLLGLTLQ